MRIPAALFLFGLSAGCGSPTEAKQQIVIDEPGQIADPGDIVMTVNGYPVGRKETDLVFARMGISKERTLEFTNSRMGQHILEDYALATAMYRQAVDEELYKDPDLQLELALGERQALTRAMHAKLARDQVTDADVQSWITSNAERLAMPQIHTRQIVVGSEGHAENLMERLDGGDDFAELAQNHSLDAESARQGGEMGWWVEGDNPVIGEAVFAHQQSQIIGPIETASGFHVVEVLERRVGTPDEEQRMIGRAVLEKNAGLDARNAVRDQMTVEWTTPPTAPTEEMPEGHPPADDGAPEGEAPADGAHGDPAEGAPAGGDGDGHP